MADRHRRREPARLRVADVPGARPLRTSRLDLEPLRAAHADEMAPLLDEMALHTFIGGRPATREELHARYTRQARGYSPDGAERWFNWIARRRDTSRAVGTVQATLRDRDGRLTAEVAWVIGTTQQGRGYAQEAARAMLLWLELEGIDAFMAHIHPRHTASATVARNIGFASSTVMVDGEVRWVRRSPR